RLAALRREHPELTEPRFGHATVDETGRRLTLERGPLAIGLNLGDADWQVPAAEVLFSTTSSVEVGPLVGPLVGPVVGPVVGAGLVDVPPGAAVLVRRARPEERR
ncbi:DUF3459 domain-containing protein, partial [Nocardioides pelophilus]|uniref:DUF3459 domain-containing protein n=1 Tax=Nocardioides pelophilus TaxID=2172019 RepID=UPI0015FF271B